MDAAEEQKFAALRALFLALPEALMHEVQREFHGFRHGGLSLPDALEMALQVIHPYGMDGSQEYDDTLAGQEIFEALKEG